VNYLGVGRGPILPAAPAPNESSITPIAAGDSVARVQLADCSEAASRA